MRKCGLLLTSTLLLAGVPAIGNELVGNFSWQFQTTADRTNRAFVEEMRQKRNNGFYAPPVYNTTIDRQYNCNVASTATGNSGSNTTQAAMPSTGGNSGSAIGNQNEKAFDLASRDLNTTVSDTQSNAGEVGSSVRGNVSSNVEDNKTSQVLNSDQQNAGTQTASVDGATACSFGALN